MLCHTTESQSSARIRGSTELLFVVADPVAQVKAPEAFNHIFATAGIDAVVVPARVAGARLEAFAHEALALGNVRGLLVSIPHKTPLMALLDRFDAVAQAAGAVNAVRRAADGALEGALFDGAGFLGALRHHRVVVAGRRVLLLGAGGAGLAIAQVLGKQPLAELAVYDTDVARATGLVARLGATARCSLRVADSNRAEGFDVVVQATPLGLRPGDPLPLDAASLDRHAVVVDILMTRQPTPLLAACRARGVSAHSGHEMLVQQIPVYLDYFGFPAVAERLRAPGDTLMSEVRQAIGSADAPGA